MELLTSFIAIFQEVGTCSPSCEDHGLLGKACIQAIRFRATPVLQEVLIVFACLSNLPKGVPL